MDIYKILSSKTHNSHHLSRYIKFIKNLENQSFQEDEFTEIHHICPKAKDLFPEYKSFKEHPWNKIVLTARQHYIAHIMLCRVFYKSVSCTFALGRMLKSSGSSKKSVLYQKFRDVYRKELSKRMQKLSAEGNHPMQRENNYAAKSIKNGTHHFLNSKVQSDINYLKVKKGTHPFLDREAARKRALKRIEEGTSHFQDSEYQRNLQNKRIEKGTHNFKGHLYCRDLQGNVVHISKEQFYSQTEPKEFVSIRSNEAKTRKLKLEKTST